MFFNGFKKWLLPTNLAIYIAVFCLFLMVCIIGIEWYYHLKPCILCQYQRYALIALIFSSGFAYINPNIGLKMMVLSCLTGLVLAIYHTGIERQFWYIQNGCLGQLSFHQDTSIKDALEHVMNQDVEDCRKVHWRFLKLSMAEWNIIFQSIFIILIIRSYLLWRNQNK